MPYKNIHFVKVKMELLEDHRFLFQLNDRQKGLYLMLLALSGKTNNKIYNDLTFIMGRLNLKELERADLERISEVFPKFRLSGEFWGFDNFDQAHNQILSKDFGISQGYPKDMQRMDKNRYRIDKNKTNTLFDRFYSEYPKKSGKENAKRSFLKLSPDEVLFKTMLDSLAVQKKSEQWTKDGGKFIPLPATWLNGKRWEDEFVGQKKTEAKPFPIKQYYG